MKPLQFITTPLAELLLRGIYKVLPSFLTKTARSKNPDILTTQLPAELLLRVYEVLPSFNDALNLRATCHILHDVWAHHRATIVNTLVLSPFECYPHARQLLAYQPDGVPLDRNDLSLSNRDLSKLIRNAKTVKQLIKRMEKDLLPKICTVKVVDIIPQSKRSTIYAGNEFHPTTRLTPTERLRVIRACYQLWLLSDCRHHVMDWRAISHSFRPRELSYCAIIAPWGCGVAKFIHTSASLEIWDCITIEMAELISENRSDFNLGIIIWDHWQDKLKRAICGTVREDGTVDIRDDMWDCELGDEGFVDC